MNIPLADQIARLERIRDELGPDPDLSAAIRTLKTLDRYQDAVRDAIRQAMAREKARNDPAGSLILEAFPDASVELR